MAIITIYLDNSVSDLCLWIKEIFKEIMHFHFMTYVARRLYM